MIVIALSKTVDNTERYRSVVSQNIIKYVLRHISYGSLFLYTLENGLTVRNISLSFFFAKDITLLHKNNTP